MPFFGLFCRRKPRNANSSLEVPLTSVHAARFDEEKDEKRADKKRLTKKASIPSAVTELTDLRQTLRNEIRSQDRGRCFIRLLLSLPPLGFAAIVIYSIYHLVNTVSIYDAARFAFIEGKTSSGKACSSLSSDYAGYFTGSFLTTTEELCKSASPYFRDDKLCAALVDKVCESSGFKGYVPLIVILGMGVAAIGFFIGLANLIKACKDHRDYTFNDDQISSVDDVKIKYGYPKEYQEKPEEYVDRILEKEKDREGPALAFASGRHKKSEGTPIHAFFHSGLFDKNLAKEVLEFATPKRATQALNIV